MLSALPGFGALALVTSVRQCEAFNMSQWPPVAPDTHAESLAELSKGRLVSVVHILKGRHSILSSLDVLELHDGSLSLQNGKGAALFDVPVTSIEARPRRRLSFAQTVFEIRAAARWWNLVAWVPTRITRHGVRAREP